MSKPSDELAEGQKPSIQPREVDARTGTSEKLSQLLVRAMAMPKSVPTIRLALPATMTAQVPA